MSKWKKTVEQRFWDNVNRDEANGCWIWAGGKTGWGYGGFSADSQYVPAHRYAYELIVGPIPVGLQLDHLCRNRACVNPAHMEPVTNKINSLRGVSFSAHNARATHCPQGHPYDLFNTYITPKGKRDCRKCRGFASNQYKIRLRLMGGTT